MELDYAFIWAAIIAFSVLVYVVLDGFDLGVGILFPLGESELDRDIMMNSVAPVWDGNETWLVLGGGGLMAVFPLAYATILPALYMPLTIMLLALVFRGVAFEYRWRTTRGKRFWDHAFFGGSSVAAIMQGIALGALVQGIEIENRAYAGGWFDWLTPFSILCGAAVWFGYGLLGATWLNMKTEGALQAKMRDYAYKCAIVTLALIAVVSFWTPFLNEDYFHKWFSFPGSLYTSIAPALVVIAIWRLFTGIKQKHDIWPFAASILLFVACFGGIGISFYPNIVPTSITIWEAAAPDNSLKFTLVGALILMPMILAYTGYAYWVFRGKVKPDAGYH